MLSKSNIPVVDTLKIFKSLNISVCFIVPTKTGLEKSIMDATKSIRDFLNEKKIHNFQNQSQGTEFKVIKSAILLSQNKYIETKISLYRPNTKNGDPRIWIYKLNDYAKPHDLLAITVNKDKLFIVNCSQSDLQHHLNDSDENFKSLFGNSLVEISQNASELLSIMKNIASKGYIKTLRPGDGGVGFTLETLLGIKANSSKLPDFHGIEIKSGRKKSLAKGRSTIFSQVPNWRISRLKGSKDILFTRGRYNKDSNRMKLYHELNAIKKNSYNMKLDLDLDQNFLHQIYIDEDSQIIDVTWELDRLKQRLAQKHKETFWVSALTKGNTGDANEEFLYSTVKHTGIADINAFTTLLETGIITLDYTIKELDSGAAKDKGYLFKISTNNLDLLFTHVKTHLLI